MTPEVKQTMQFRGRALMPQLLTTSGTPGSGEPYAVDTITSPAFPLVYISRGLDHSSGGQTFYLE